MTLPCSRKAGSILPSLFCTSVPTGCHIYYDKKHFSSNEYVGSLNSGSVEGPCFPRSASKGISKFLFLFFKTITPPAPRTMKYACDQTIYALVTLRSDNPNHQWTLVSTSDYLVVGNTRATSTILEDGEAVDLGGLSYWY